mmetsp:Transcript_45790/g.146190  ORF Transcript_45790/g.146190 Transcript_45790/m.146190 type:complete len:208 (-) Transcript_45790:531-1154(-)
MALDAQLLAPRRPDRMRLWGRLRAPDEVGAAAGAREALQVAEVDLGQPRELQCAHALLQDLALCRHLRRLQVLLFTRCALGMQCVQADPDVVVVQQDTGRIQVPQGRGLLLAPCLRAELSNEFLLLSVLLWLVPANLAGDRVAVKLGAGLWIRLLKPGLTGIHLGVGPKLALLGFRPLCLGWACRGLQAIQQVTTLLLVLGCRVKVP